MRTNETRSRKLDRRDFLRQTGRYTLLSALTMLGIFGIYKRKKVPASECIQAGYCSSCNALASCALPEAFRERSLQ